MVSRSLEKMMLIAIGLSTVVIVGVPVLMYAIDTINTTTQLQEAQQAAELMFNATALVDDGVTNTTSINVWLNPGVSLMASGNTLTVLYAESPGLQKAWDQTYNHEVSIDTPSLSHSETTLYRMEVVMVAGVIHISFFVTVV
jgi:hypothetical protein